MLLTIIIAVTSWQKTSDTHISLNNSLAALLTFHCLNLLPAMPHHILFLLLLALLSIWVTTAVEDSCEYSLALGLQNLPSTTACLCGNETCYSNELCYVLPQEDTDAAFEDFHVISLVAMAVDSSVITCKTLLLIVFFSLLQPHHRSPLIQPIYVIKFRVTMSRGIGSGTVERVVMQVKILQCGQQWLWNSLRVSSPL